MSDADDADDASDMNAFDRASARNREEVIQSSPRGWNGGGRRPYDPSDETRVRVQRMVSYGIKHDVIADILGISDKTLRKYFAHEIRVGLGSIVEEVANSLVEKAKSDRPDAVNAAKFFLQSRGDWAEKTEDVTEVRHEERIEKRREALDRARNRRGEQYEPDGDL